MTATGECKYLLERLAGPLLIPATVTTEVGILLERRRGTYAELAFLSDVRAGRYTLIESLSVDLERVAELVTKYDDLPLGTVDTSVIALAELRGVFPAGHVTDSRRCPDHSDTADSAASQPRDGPS